MKQTLVAFAVLIFVSCNEQQNSYVIEGNVKGIPDGAIIDLYVSSGQAADGISFDTIKNGQFNFNGTLKSRPSKMFLQFRDEKNFFGSCDLWVDHEFIEISGYGKHPSSWMVKGNNKELIALNKIKDKTRESLVRQDSLRLLINNSAKDADSTKLLWDEIDSIKLIRKTIELQIIEKNPNSLSAVEMLYWRARFDSDLDKNRIKNTYDNLNSLYQNTIYGEGILSIIQDENIPKVGDTVKNFVAYDTIGQKHNLITFKGKYILLDFWASNCLPCIQALPETRNLHANNQEILTIVGVSMDVDEDKWKETSLKDSITWINLFDGKGSIAGASADYGIESFPTYFLIDPNGVIIDKWIGYEPNELNEKLSRHIKEIMF